MWINSFELNSLNNWLENLSDRIPSGKKDPYTSSMRNSSRFVSALRGTAASRQSQQETDLTAAQLYDRANSRNTVLGDKLLSYCDRFSIPLDDELSTVLILFIEGIIEKNDLYLLIARFWYKVSSVFPLEHLANNVSASYLLSYMSVPDQNTQYSPLHDIISKSRSSVDAINVDELRSLQLTEKANNKLTFLLTTINGYATRSSRKEMLEALNIIFSFNKSDVIDRICNPITDAERNKRVKLIISYFFGCFTFSGLLYDKIAVDNFVNRLPNTLQGNYPLQQIYYGAPGTGKSHTANKVAEQYATVRTTFHPDSDYSTFVGAYKPTMTEIDMKVVPVVIKNGISLDEHEGTFKEKRIAYKFVKQAYLKAYIGAWKLFRDTCKEGVDLAPQFLLIEEINRGNCAQIFGDLFQLLDRKNGFSEYPIDTDEDIVKALLDDNPEDGLSFGKDGLKLSAEQMAYIDSLYDKPGKPKRNIAEKICKGQILCLPKNLYIWATMNTSDQSLFPIDSAFKRRWDWRYVRISEGKTKDGQPMNYRINFVVPKNEANGVLDETTVDVPWWTFVQAINKKIEDATKSEDKKLGYFFCKPDKASEEGKDNDIISAETFVGKVVFYLWQDVFKDYGFKSDIFKREDGSKISFHDFYPENAVVDNVVNPEGINLKLVKYFIEKVIKNTEK